MRSTYVVRPKSFPPSCHSSGPSFEDGAGRIYSESTAECQHKNFKYSFHLSGEVGILRRKRWRRLRRPPPPHRRRSTPEQQTATVTPISASKPIGFCFTMSTSTSASAPCACRCCCTILRGTGGNVGIFGRCIPCRAPLNNPGRFEDLRAASPGLNDRGNASLSASPGLLIEACRAMASSADADSGADAGARRAA